MADCPIPLQKLRRQRRRTQSAERGCFCAQCDNDLHPDRSLDFVPGCCGGEPIFSHWPKAAFFSELGIFVVFLVLTLIVVWLVYAGKVVSANEPMPLPPRRWPKWEMFAATVAYA